MNVKVGDKGSYSLISNITVDEIREKTVVMIDKSGNKKEVYRSLFNKYFTPNDRTTAAIKH